MQDYKEDLSNILKIDQNGGVFIYPTDTVLGLGASILNENGINKIRIIKERTADQGFILLCSSRKMILNYVTFIDPKIDRLFEFHKRPLTVIYEAGENVPPHLIGQDNSIAIRLVDNDFLVDLIDHLGAPIISTSANLKGKEPAKSLKDLDPKLTDNMDYVCKYQIKNIGSSQPSSIVKLDRKGELLFIRE